MGDDLVRALGYANLDTRLKRISDRMSHSLRSMYKELGIDVEPNWYLVLLIVKEQPNSSVMEIAEKLKFTHQSVINMTNKMIGKDYLISEKDSEDKRKTVFRLTEKAKSNFPLFHRIWEIGKTVIYELLNGKTEIIEHLELLEINLEEASFGQRIAQQLKSKKDGA